MVVNNLFDNIFLLFYERGELVLHAKNLVQMVLLKKYVCRYASFYHPMETPSLENSV